MMKLQFGVQLTLVTPLLQCDSGSARAQHDRQRAFVANAFTVLLESRRTVLMSLIALSSTSSISLEMNIDNIFSQSILIRYCYQ